MMDLATLELHKNVAVRVDTYPIQITNAHGRRKCRSQTAEAPQGYGSSRSASHFPTWCRCSSASLRRTKLHRCVDGRLRREAGHLNVRQTATGTVTTPGAPANPPCSPLRQSLRRPIGKARDKLFACPERGKLADEEVGEIANKQAVGRAPLHEFKVISFHFRTSRTAVLTIFSW